MNKPVQIKAEMKTPIELRKLARAVLMLVEQEQKKPAKPEPKRKAS